VIRPSLYLIIIEHVGVVKVAEGTLPQQRRDDVYVAIQTVPVNGVMVSN